MEPSSVTSTVISSPAATDIEAVAVPYLLSVEVPLVLLLTVTVKPVPVPFFFTSKVTSVDPTVPRKPSTRFIVPLAGAVKANISPVVKVLPSPKARLTCWD